MRLTKSDRTQAVCHGQQGSRGFMDPHHTGGLSRFRCAIPTPPLWFCGFSMSLDTMLLQSIRVHKLPRALSARQLMIQNILVLP